MMDKQTIRAAMADGKIVGDGHGLYPPSFYAPHFDVAALGLVRTHRSDGTPKGSIFVNGTLVSEMDGVYNLEFLEWLRRELGLRASSMLGRGSAAQDYVNMVKEWLGNES